MQQQPAGIGIAGVDEDRDHLEIAARLFLGPVMSSGGQSFQAERVVALDMTDVAAGMVGPFGQKHRLDAAFEKFVVEFRRGWRRCNRVGGGERGHSRHD
jgi:hypothetical protein